MSPRARLDKELVRRKIARSREAARELIGAGRVEVGGFVAAKPATMVDDRVSIRVSGPVEKQWASRGAHKLIGALDAFGPAGVSVAGKRVLDAGASTGGFTDVLLDRGARQVVAVDVGYGQLIQRLARDPRVSVVDRTNIRTITPKTLGGEVEMMVGDVSFISLRLVLPAVMDCLAPGADLLPMVKPQFEVGKDDLPKGAVVTSPQQRADAVAGVAEFAVSLGLGFKGVVASPLPGPSGNVEYFLWLSTDPDCPVADRATIDAQVSRAVEEGPTT
ncbi:TlyA family RNA methyltransferase [Corynebacterium mendelii]|uniref:TlyA family RNA methyltransferase n=1 Tax=Corynebacterium mendelii TaxID=2765362 RepID=A0A939DYX9_9CORY|nr:TlyA family RNA methyltransferase [Corynebacterium mendelii]MBN9643588.1 TlyA family RNA methyltransferase [Corynebacterium mendelii]